MRIFLALSISIFLASCSKPYVYWDELYSNEPKDEQMVSSFAYAYLQASDTVTMESTDSQPGISLFSMKAKSSSIIVAPTGISAQGFENREINWIRVPNTPQTSRIVTQSSGSGIHCPETGSSPWDQAYKRFICEYSKGSGHSTMGATSRQKLIAVEPEYGFYDRTYLEKVGERERERDSRAKKSESETTTITDEPSPFWPVGEGLTWHRGPNYSQLDAALEEVRKTRQKPVKAAHLDAGYFATDTLRPKNALLENDSETCLPKGVQCHTDTPNDGDHAVARPDGNHGSRTISVLAGGTANLKIPKYPAEITLGAYPELQVASFRITTTWPVHINTSAMAIAIAEATNKDYDVITLSQGGFPSIILREAVNKAYNEGTAIFAATGDYFTVPIFGSVTPRTVAFPARFNRVMAVAGVTANHTSYSKDPCYLCLWRVGSFFSWSLRGSYGPTSAMAGHTIAGYAPNITTSVSNKKNANAIQLDGDGVSFAVPQVAAAGAMWLQEHRGEFSPEEWKSWVKTEAVYGALIKSAKKNFLNYSCEYMGEGVLRAVEALRIDRAKALGQAPKAREVSTIGYKWVFDLVMSWDALKIAIALPVEGGFKVDEQFQNSLKEMVFTEIQQILHRSDKASEIFEKIYPSPPPSEKKCPTFESKSQYVKEFIEQLLSEDKISNLLRSFLKVRMQEIASGK